MSASESHPSAQQAEPASPDPARPALLRPDLARIDRLMEAAGLDVLLVTSKHNVQYLLGGYRFIFFAAMDAIGHSRYLPVVIYRRGQPDQAAYIGNRMEGAEHANHPFWTPTVLPATWGAVDAAALALEHLQKIGAAGLRIGIEPSFLPVNAHQVLAACPGLADATTMLEQMRAIKTPAELALLRQASELITDAMMATIGAAQDGWTKTRIIEELRRQETMRGLHFDYCLLTLGASHNRASSDQVWRAGEVLSIDSGGNYHGYIGDLCRMGLLGDPDGELQDLLAQVEAVQQAAFAHVKPGIPGGVMIAEAEAVLRGLPAAPFTDFFAHGMGLISHEVPFLMTNHPVAYEGVDATRALQEGMVISVETTMLHPTRGFIKLEDTLAVTATGHEMFGDRGRGWNRGGI
ncbi:aminopeptidase P family protein [Fertoebacter nigrum]|uniref:Aminopeptidase P family protein n=1 Tax=Fertoeibacter niger TaxID=2656921 RepID=A0A8X8KM85_9RHOB|nr:Xaa-Pro peptidase family protein [Fertoeibacter niger]NUB43655.1 aminopeptidase P family protein [Fertoeibacter niger]